MKRLRLVFLACTLFSVSMFVYTGRVFGIDGRGILATSITFVRTGEWNINSLSAMHWDAPPPGGQGLWGTDGDYFSKKAPLAALVHLPSVWLAEQFPIIETIPLALLTIPSIYALTAVLIALAAERLGWNSAWAIFAALTWAFGSFALANTQEIFAEPIMAFGLSLALWQMLALRPSRQGALIAGIGAMLIIGANPASAFLIPFIWLGIIWHADTKIPRWQRTLIWLIPILLMVLILAYYNGLRTGNIFVSGYYFGAGEGFTSPMWLGLFGLLLGGYRGLIWYAPLSLLILPSLWISRKKFDYRLWLLFALLLAQLIPYSMWWAWHGGSGWGPRFLLPVLPAICLLSLPALAQLLMSKTWRWLAWLLLAYAIYIQFPAALSHYSDVEGALFQLLPNIDAEHYRALAFLSPLNSPVFSTWRYFLPWPYWLAQGNYWIGFVLLALSCIQAGFLFLSYRSALKAVLSVLGLSLAILSAAVVVLNASVTWQIAQQAELEAYFAGQPSEGILLNTNSYWDFLYVDDAPSGYSIPTVVQSGDEQAEAILERFTGSADSLFSYMSVSFEPNWIERRLWDAAYIGDDVQIGGFRLLPFALHETRGEWQTVEASFEGIILERYLLEQSNGLLYLGLQWRGDWTNRSLFVHLLDANGAILEQHDRAPQASLDRHLFRLDRNPMASHLRIGWVDAEGRLLAVNDGDFLLLPIER